MPKIHVQYSATQNEHQDVGCENDAGDRFFDRRWGYLCINYLDMVLYFPNTPSEQAYGTFQKFPPLICPPS
jgi:hypothetical protein